MQSIDSSLPRHDRNGRSAIDVLENLENRQFDASLHSNYDAEGIRKS
jgi:hypothetical protein